MEYFEIKEIVYDVDDVLWGLNDRVCKINNINVDYVSVNQLNKYLEDNKLDANKIVIFKEEQTQFKNEKYNVISFNCYTTQNPKDMIIDNYKKIYYNKLFQ